ncbi:OmpP1/FadL family transporter [Geomesophilobacter sediminis]|uniref:Outer membrane protein transport protein n=1 Tax=Geomesophilobacter sediminis TaxID=2798584 RepID=A0A8J7IVU9_9BACT|nr:outer membrane protein transport protein [Geomesophilobacter sediminis]MBJ6723392.1 outer membrane protein transport protein [Geomesophilobacter sediminis]
MVGLLLRHLFAAAILLIGSRSYGSGFGIFTQGGAALGEADAVVAHGARPSAIFFNPALIAGLPGTQAELGTTFIVPNRSFIGDDGSRAATRDPLFTPSTVYLTRALGGGFTLGLGAFNPFGLGTDWGGTWSGRYLVSAATLNSYAVNPVLAFRPLPAVAVAAGIDVVVADATLEGRIPAGAPGGSDLVKRFSGSGTGVGYNVGILLELGKAVTLGASYRAEVPVTLEGELVIGGRTIGEGKSSITLPRQLFAGIAWQPTECLVLESGLRYEGWSSLSAIRIELSGAPSVGPETGGTEDPRQWHGSWAANLGGRYQLNQWFSLAAGYLYGTNPVPDRTFEPAVPDADTHLFCLGAGVRRQRLQLDLGYGYQLQKSRVKNTNQYGAQANGRYEADLHLVGVSVGYRF